MGDEVGRNVAYYYCLKHETVEPEAGCKAKNRLGPFDDPITAAHALEIIADREQQKEEEDRRWRDD